MLSLFLLLLSTRTLAAIDRYTLVSRYNPTRNASSLITPMQVGNGNFAFGADVTGLQTFQPFAIMSSWGWKNDSLPEGKTVDDVNNYHGTSWDNHGLLVEYDFGGADEAIEQWLTANPNRVNLGRVGLVFRSAEGEVLNVTESNLTGIHQELDLWTGTITSGFSFGEVPIMVTTTCAQDRDTVGISVESALLTDGQLGVFVDYPWNDGSSSFSAPFVGNWDVPANHTTSLSTDVNGHNAEITHTLDEASFITSFDGDAFTISRDSPDAHRYTILPRDSTSTFQMAATYGIASSVDTTSYEATDASSRTTWDTFWSRNGFIDVVTESSDQRADELQRRIILSRYLMRVNEAGDTPPQESGLVNNGWHLRDMSDRSFWIPGSYRKFHMEMYFWHSAHWALWNNWDLLNRSIGTYDKFLPSSITRSQKQQHWPSGARWPKMTDPSGRSSPGDINNLLIWQQPHPLVFAQYDYRASPTIETLRKWEDVVRETANWMAAFAWYNESTGVYNFGPPMYVLAYWRLGLGLAQEWMEKLNAEVPKNWMAVKDNLAPLPVENGTYKICETVENDFWTDPNFIFNHPALVGLYGWLPETKGLNLTIAKATADKVRTHYNVTYFWGWDFPMLAMSSARNGDAEGAVEWLLDPVFDFDDVGMPMAPVRHPPYFPGSGGLLYAVAMMASGWDGSEGDAPGFPKDGWVVRYEDLSKAL
ncbi:Six-hairpin glycosidase-like protein [Armillaria mellea]|nr:Six-hairpin glycosidase-like protein [Armillaria mellea]